MLKRLPRRAAADTDSLSSPPPLAGPRRRRRRASADSTLGHSIDLGVRRAHCQRGARPGRPPRDNEPRRAVRPWDRAGRGEPWTRSRPRPFSLAVRRRRRGASPSDDRRGSGRARLPREPARGRRDRRPPTRPASSRCTDRVRRTAARGARGAAPGLTPIPASARPGEARAPNPRMWRRRPQRHLGLTSRPDPRRNDTDCGGPRQGSPPLRRPRAKRGLEPQPSPPPKEVDGGDEGSML